MDDNSEWTGWQAIIRPTPYGTFGIHWKNAPAMEARGGYSGPYDTREDAETGVRRWCKFWAMQDCDFEVIHSDDPDK